MKSKQLDEIIKALELITKSLVILQNRLDMLEEGHINLVFGVTAVVTSIEERFKIIEKNLNRLENRKTVWTENLN